MLLLNVTCMYGSKTYSLWTQQLLSMVRGEIGLDIFHPIRLLLNQHIELKIKQMAPAYTIVQNTIKLLYE